MTKKQYLVVAILSIASFSVGMFMAPKSQETKNEQKRITNTNQHVTESTKETRLPNGTIIIEKRKDKETEKTSQTEKSSSSRSETRPSYRAGFVYEPAIKGFQEVSYSLVLEKRILSELYVGLSVSSNKTLGVTLSLGF